MAVVNLKGSRIMTGLDAATPVLADAGEGGGRVKVWCETVEVTAADSVSSTYLLARLPSNARIFGISRVYWDDMATTGSPTLNIGVFNQSGRSEITNDPDALSSAHALSSAGSASAISDIANNGLPLWDFVANVTADPKVDLDIKATLAGAAVTTGGTLTVELYYAYD